MWLTADSCRGSEKRREDKYHLGTFAPFCVAQGWALPPLHLGKASLSNRKRGEGHRDYVFKDRDGVYELVGSGKPWSLVTGTPLCLPKVLGVCSPIKW